MRTEWKSVECAPDCGFLVRGRDEEELIRFAVAHSTAHHEVALAPADVKARMKAVRSEPILEAAMADYVGF